jgi:peptidoglycan lytic transglycosylase
VNASSSFRRLRLRHRWLLPCLAAAGALLALAPLVLVLAAFRGPLRVQSSEGLGGLPATEGRLADLPLEEWTSRLMALEAAQDWAGLDRELTEVHQLRPEVYAQEALGYLHARTKLRKGDLSEAAEGFSPFLAAGHPWRDLALHYRAAILDQEKEREEASLTRQDLIFNHPKGAYRKQAIADEVEYLAGHGGAAALGSFLARLTDVDTATRRSAEARLVEVLLDEKDEAAALERGLRLLRDNGTDDASDRVARALDRSALVERMGPEDWAMVGESLRTHRHFDRALALLERALPRLPARREDLLFAMGRAYFGAEQYAAAEKAYLEAAAQARDADGRAGLLYQAARCAQLQGDDARAETHLGRAIGEHPQPAPPRRASRRRRAPRSHAVVAGSTPRVAASLTQRMRIRLAAKRYADAEADLRAIKRLFPRDEAVADAVVAYATAMVSAGKPGAALLELRSIGARRFEPQDAAEMAYWTARSLEPGPSAVEVYLSVLKAPVATHFAYLARDRLAGPLEALARSTIASRTARVDTLLKEGRLEEARATQTEVVLLTPLAEAAPARERLRQIYRELPVYREIVDLQPLPFPRLPVVPVAPAPGAPPAASATPAPGTTAPPAPAPAAPPRADGLMALGLFDDALDRIPERYPVASPPSGFARARALNLGEDLRGAIQASEALMGAVPDDYVSALLPDALRRLLYPRYFYSYIREQAEKYGADPLLVLSVMREESRFDVRAKSAAAARGLLQFIIGTAREVGRQIGLLEVAPEDLYDPRVVIPLGAKYTADLSRQFGGDPYLTAAAYNAGPNQARLWLRMAPGSDHDLFLSAINFDETKNYVRKVLNSHRRYREIYGEEDARGGPPTSHR